jgi:enamine deaminase RidA (YjgF/YER057c/UK114 family)
MAEPAKIIRTDWAGRFNRVVEAGGFVFLAGVVARKEDADIAAQTADVLAQIDELLAKAKATKADLVAANIWLADISDMGAMNAVWDTWVDPANGPVRATVESKLARPGLRIEIQVKAYKG